MNSNTNISEVNSKEKGSSQMNKDLINTILGGFEMALLVKRNKYDQKVLYDKPKKWSKKLIDKFPQFCKFHYSWF